MINVDWDVKFELGHEKIDFEHRIFLGLIKSASRLVPAPENAGRITRTLQEVLKYAEFHFLSEENLMIDIGYPDIDRHHQEHEMLLGQLRSAIQKVRPAEGGIDPLVDFLFQWFALHTTQVDKRLTAFIAQGQAGQPA